MGLLDSILSASGAEQYKDNFKKYNIDVFTLKVVQDEDLQLIGVTDENIRNSVLKHAANLKISPENTADIVVNKEYMQLVLNQMSIQIHRHFASLSLPLIRKDVVICNLKLAPATKCLLNCVNSLEEQLYEFEEKVSGKKANKKYVIMNVFSGVAFSVLVAFYCKKYLIK